MLLVSATSLFARPQLHNLDIRVVLSKNGDAHITETRQMEIDGEGTECYIVIGSLNGSEVSDLTVSDETGRVFSNIGVLLNIINGMMRTVMTSPCETY